MRYVAVIEYTEEKKKPLLQTNYSWLLNNNVLHLFINSFLYPAERWKYSSAVILFYEDHTTVDHLA